MGVPRRTNYTRYDVRTLEEIIKPELLETWNSNRNTYTFQTISVKYNVEQGLLMILVSSLWETFKETYEANNKDGTYLNWKEYRNNEGSIQSLTKKDQLF